VTVAVGSLIYDCRHGRFYRKVSVACLEGADNSIKYQTGYIIDLYVICLVCINCTHVAPKRIKHA